MTAGIVSAKQRDTGEFLPLHPDRRGHQPRQLGRAADQHARRSGRHQLADLQPLGRLHGHLVRDPDRRGDSRVGPAARQRPRDPRTHRRDDRAGDQGSGRVHRPGQARRARWCRASRPAGRPTRRASKPATSSPRSTARRSKSRATCRASSAPPSPGAKATLQVFRRGASRDIAVTVVEFEPEKPRRVAQGGGDPAGPAQDRDRAGGVRSRRSAKARTEAARRRACRDRRGCSRARRAARGRRDRDDRQHRDHRRQAVQRRWWPRPTSREPISVMVRRGDWTSTTW